MLQRIAQSCFKFVLSELCIARIMLIYKQLSITYLRAVNSHRFNQSDRDTRSWYHGTAASMECLQAPLGTPSSPEHFRLVPLALDYTRLSRPKSNREPVRRLSGRVSSHFFSYFISTDLHFQNTKQRQCNYRKSYLRCLGSFFKHFLRVERLCRLQSEFKGAL